MGIPTSVDELVGRWEELRDAGTPVAVDDLCTGRPHLIPEVRRQIEALRAMDSALNTRALNPRSETNGGDLADLGGPEVARASASYRVRCPHRGGGLGVVYRADQEGLDRPVALKRIRPGQTGNARRRRFLREAALTARLQHPGVVPIYDLGQDDGGPFYTMPFIEGRTLGEAIEAFHDDESLRGDPGERGLRLRGLLQPFIAACNAVEYAHHREVVHRDLKPSNIMLGPFGETLVMDWGLAKLFGRDGAASEDGAGTSSPGPLCDDVTANGQVPGTPMYMSPEQARNEPVGAASDIYSLGLILYAILTGRPAYDESVLPGPELLQAVRAAAIVPPRRRDPRLPRALEAICLKAMAARPDDRYGRARDLAEDLNRWLADEPVSAWREPVSARARRWGRRHRTFIAAVMVGLVAGVMGLGAVSVVQARANDRLKKAKDETDRALVAAREAEARTWAALAESRESQAQAEAVSRFLVDAFRSPDPWQVARDVKVIDVLDRASEQLDGGFGGPPAIRGALLDALGRTYLGLGLAARAIGPFTTARAVREAALGADHPDTLATRARLANAYEDGGRLRDAIALHEATLDRRIAALGPDHHDTNASRHDLAVSYIVAGRLDEAIGLLAEVRRYSEAELGRDHPDTLKCLRSLAGAYRAAGRHLEAVELNREALARTEDSLGPDHLDALMSRMNLGIACRFAGKLDEAIELHRKVLEGYRARLGEDHPLTLKCRVALEADYGDAGRWSDAVPSMEETLRLAESKVGSVHPLTFDCRNNLAAAYHKVGRTAQAVALQEETLGRIEEKLGRDHPNALMMRINLASSYFDAARISNATDLFRLSMECSRARFGPDHPFTLYSCQGLAACYGLFGRREEAERLHRAVIASRRRTVRPDSPLMALDLATLGQNLLDQSRWSEAEPPLREALAIYEKAAPGDWLRYHAMSLLGGSLMGQGRHAEAEPRIIDGYVGLKAREAAIPVSDRSSIRQAAERVVRLYEDWGRPEQTAGWKLRVGMSDLPAEVISEP